MTVQRMQDTCWSPIEVGTEEEYVTLDVCSFSSSTYGRGKAALTPKQARQLARFLCEAANEAQETEEFRR